MIDWKTYGVTITIRDDGPKCYKQYRRDGKMFWRNYRRDIPGGVSFIQRFDDLTQITARIYRERLAETIFPSANPSAL